MKNDDHFANEMNKIFAALERAAAKKIAYLIAEGFIEPTEVSGVYKYTPEGQVLMEQEYRRMRDEGLL